MKTFFALVYFYILVFCGSCFYLIMADWVRSGRTGKDLLKKTFSGKSGQKGV